MVCTFSWIVLSLGVLFSMNEICSGELLCLTDFLGQWEPCEVYQKHRQSPAPGMQHADGLESGSVEKV